MRILQFGLVVVTCFLALHVASSLPFYHAWDMDLTTLHDLLLMQSGWFPTHMNHPGLGMYWIFLWAQKIAQWIQFLTPVNIETLFDSYQPLTVLAEQMDFLRQMNALMGVMVGIVCWQSLEILKLSRWSSLFALVAALFLPGIWRFDLYLIRTETYAIFFWCIAFMYVVLCAQAKTWAQANRFALLSGFFAALSFFTKIQSFFLLFALPLVYVLLRSGRPHYLEEANKKPRVFFWVTTIGFFVLLKISVDFPKPSYVNAFSENFVMNKFSIIYFLVVLLAALFVNRRLPFPASLISTRLNSISETYSKWENALGESFQKHAAKNFVSKFGLGTCFILLITFLLPVSPLFAAEYLALNFKMVFARLTQYSEVGRIPPFENFLNMFPMGLLDFIFWIGIFGFALWSFSKRKERTSFFMTLLLGSIMIFQVFLGVRAGEQDRLWLEVPFFLIGSILIIRCSEKKFIFPLALAIFAILNATSAAGLRGPQKGFHGHLDSRAFFEEVYRFGKYEEKMKEFYPTPESKDEAIQFALRWQDWKNLIQQTLSAPELGLKDVQPLQGNGMAISLARVMSDRIRVVFRSDVQIWIMSSQSESDFQYELRDCVAAQKMQSMIANKVSLQGFLLDVPEGISGHPRECGLFVKDWKTTWILFRQAASARSTK